jgi:hypothetical protein
VWVRSNFRTRKDDAQIVLLRCAASEMTFSDRIAILSPLLVGLAATLGTMLIHGFVVHTVIMGMRRDLQRGRLGVRLGKNLTFVSGTALFSLAGHVLEIALWAFAFDLCGAAADSRQSLYCSASIMRQLTARPSARRLGEGLRRLAFPARLRRNSSTPCCAASIPIPAPFFASVLRGPMRLNGRVLT